MILSVSAHGQSMVTERTRLDLVSSIYNYISSCIRHQSCTLRTLRKGSDLFSVAARSTALLLRLSRHSNCCGLRPIYCTNTPSWHFKFVSFGRLGLRCGASGTSMQGISNSVRKCGEAIIEIWDMSEQSPKISRERIS